MHIIYLFLFNILIAEESNDMCIICCYTLLVLSFSALYLDNLTGDERNGMVALFHPSLYFQAHALWLLSIPSLYFHARGLLFLSIPSLYF